MQKNISNKIISTLLHSTPHLLNRVEAAKYLGVTVSTLAVWACNKRYNLPYVKVGRLVKYRQADLDQFITQHVINQVEQ